MDLYLQFGYGMKEHCKHLIQKWGSGTVILSPRDLTPDKILRTANEIVEVNGTTLLDPQLYDPRATYPRLAEHSYWPNDFNTGMLSGGSPLNKLLMDIRVLNDMLQTNRYIIPGIYCQRVDDDWCAIQEAINEAAISVFTEKKRLATICLSAEVLRFDDQIENILSCTESWDVDGYYIVAEHPRNQYLVDDPLWLTNLLLLCAGLKLQGREVILGYSCHQMLCLAVANIDAIASGSWKSVRSFTTDRFQHNDEDGVNSPGRRATWYYCPQSLSEYKAVFLDMAFREGILNQLKPEPSLNSEYADILFSGAQPSSTAYSESLSFRHYLHCLRGQCAQARRASFRETLKNYMLLLERAEGLITTFHSAGVRGQDRDFDDIIDVNKTALCALEASRGFVLEREWFREDIPATSAVGALVSMKQLW